MRFTVTLAEDQSNVYAIYSAAGAEMSIPPAFHVREHRGVARGLRSRVRIAIADCPLDSPIDFEWATYRDARLRARACAHALGGLAPCGPLQFFAWAGQGRVYVCVHQVLSCPLGFRLRASKSTYNPFDLISPPSQKSPKSQSSAVPQIYPRTEQLCTLRATRPDLRAARTY